MKNKKITALLMCMVLLFSAPCVHAYDSAAADEALLEQYLGLFDALGIDTVPSDSTVTRGGFIITLISLMDFDTHDFNRHTFADVSTSNSELLSAVEYAVGIGAVSAGEFFYPDRPITYPEACKMTVEVLGYGKDAQWKGGYPTGYLAAASSIDLDVGVNTDGEFTAADMYVLLGNAANTRIKVMTSCDENDGFVTYTLEPSASFLEVYRGITKAEGIITAGGGGYLYDSTAELDRGKVMIGDEEYYVADGVICPLGYYACTYISTRGSKNEIIYADISDNRVTTVAASQLSDFDGTALSYTDASGNDKVIRCGSDTAIVYNGKACENYSADDIIIKDGYIEAIDNDGNNTVDVLSVWEAVYLEVDYVNVYSSQHDYVFYDKNRKNNIFVNTDDMSVSCNTALSSIKSGNVIEAYISKDKSFVKINLTGNTVSGTISEIGTDGRLYIGDKCYTATAYFKEFYSKEVSCGKNISIAVDSFDRAIAVASAAAGSMKLAYLDSTAKRGSLDASLLLKLFTEDSEVITPAFADKVVLNGQSESAESVYAKLSASQGQLIKFTLNTDGDVAKINTEGGEEGIFDLASDGADALKRFRFENDETETTVYYKIFGYFVPYFTLNSSTKIFCVSTGESSDEDRFSIGTLSFLGNDEKVSSDTLRVYNVDIAGCAGALLYKNDAAASVSLSVTSSTAMVASCTNAIDSEGIEVYKIKLYSSDKYTVLYIQKDAAFIKAMNLKEGEFPYNTGDIIRYAADDKKGYMLTAVKDFDAKTRSLIYNAGHNTELHYYYGSIYAIGESSVAIKQSDGTVIYVPAVIGDVGIVENGEVFTQPKEKVTSYVQMGDECHKILIKCRYSSPTQIFVYK